MFYMTFYLSLPTSHHRNFPVEELERSHLLLQAAKPPLTGAQLDCAVLSANKAC